MRSISRTSKEEIDTDDGLHHQKDQQRERHNPQQSDPFHDREVAASMLTFDGGAGKRSHFTKGFVAGNASAETAAEIRVLLNDPNGLLPGGQPRTEKSFRLMSLV